MAASYLTNAVRIWITNTEKDYIQCSMLVNDMTSAGRGWRDIADKLQAHAAKMGPRAIAWLARIYRAAVADVDWMEIAKALKV